MNKALKHNKEIVELILEGAQYRDSPEFKKVMEKAKDYLNEIKIVENLGLPSPRSIISDKKNYDIFKNAIASMIDASEKLKDSFDVNKLIPLPKYDFDGKWIKVVMVNGKRFLIVSPPDWVGADSEENYEDLKL